MGKNKLNINLLIENSHPALMPSVVARVSGPNSYNSPDLLSDEHISLKKNNKKHFPLTHVSLKHTQTHIHTTFSFTQAHSLPLIYLHVFSPFPLFSLSSHFFLSHIFLPLFPFSLFPSLYLSATHFLHLSILTTTLLLPLFLSLSNHPSFSKTSFLLLSFCDNQIAIQYETHCRVTPILNKQTNKQYTNNCNYNINSNNNNKTIPATTKTINNKHKDPLNSS